MLIAYYWPISSGLWSVQGQSALILFDPEVGKRSDFYATWLPVRLDKNCSFFSVSFLAIVKVVELIDRRYTLKLIL